MRFRCCWPLGESDRLDGATPLPQQQFLRQGPDRVREPTLHLPGLLSVRIPVVLQKNTAGFTYTS